MTRTVSPEGIALIVGFETFRALCYDDKQPNTPHPVHVIGFPTWGYGDRHDMTGALLQAADVGVRKISVDDAKKLLSLRLQETVAAIYGACGAAADKLTDDQFGALVSFIYNTGAATGAPVLNLIKLGKADQAPNHMILYVKSGGVRMEGLVRRRRAEIDLWRKDQTITTGEADTGAMPIDPAHLMKPLWKSRTFWASAVGVAAALGTGATAAINALTPFDDKSHILHVALMVCGGVSGVSAFLTGMFRAQDVATAPQA